MKRRENTVIVNFLKRSEMADITRVEILRLSGLVSISTRGNRLEQVGLILVTGFEVAGGNRVTTSPHNSLTVIRSKTVDPGVEASFRVLPLLLKKRLMTREIIDRTRVIDNHLEMNGLLWNASPSSTEVGNEGGGGGGAPSSSRTCLVSTASSKCKMGKS